MCSIAYDIGNTAFKNSYFIKYYKKGLIEEACSRIMVWSYIKDQLSLAMEYRRDIDYTIFTESDYKYRGNIK
jgi:GH24 family phage-related lysozyme (muramidase)